MNYLSRSLRLIILLLALALAFYLLFKPGEQSSELPAIPVVVHTIVGGPISERVIVSGTTRASERAMLRFQVSGRLDKKMVRLGDQVIKGQVLAVFYNPEIKPALAQAKQNEQRLKVQLSQAKRDFNRIDELFLEQAVTKQEWETAKSALDSASTAVNAAIAASSRAQGLEGELGLTAPFDGVVTEILLDEGEVVQAGEPALRLSNPSSVELEIAVSDSVISNMAIGQEVFVSKPLEPTSEPLLGLISDISPFRERGSLPQVVVNLDAERIQPGVAVAATLNILRGEGISLPLKAVLMTGDDMAGVYVVEDNIARLTSVRPVNIRSTDVIVDAGLNVGDKIVTQGVAQLFDGAKVEVQ